MADTGAPHFIPFLDGTELVRAYPDFSEDLADAVADGLTAAGNAGIGSNVVQVSGTNTLTTTSTTFTATELTASITPSSDTSKVLVLYVFPIVIRADNGRNVTGEHRLVSGSNVLRLYSEVHFSAAAAATGRRNSVSSGQFLHSPETTSPVTYTVEFRVVTTGDGRAFAVEPSAAMVLIEVAP